MPTNGHGAHKYGIFTNGNGAHKRGIVHKWGTVPTKGTPCASGTQYPQMGNTARVHRNGCPEMGAQKWTWCPQIWHIHKWGTVPTKGALCTNGALCPQKGGIVHKWDTVPTNGQYC